MRRLASRKIAEAQREAGAKHYEASFWYKLWELCALPHFLPLLAPAAAITISLVESAMSSDLKVGSPLPVFRQTDSSRDILGLLWQVEGSILALVTAVVLFAFEGLTRARPGVPMWEYAGRSGLAQYLMLGGAGLAAIPVALFWHSDRPPLAAAHFAAAVSVLGIVALPFLVYRAMRLIDATWLRTQRLGEVRQTVARLVRDEAIERVVLNELDEHAKASNLKIRPMFPRDDGNVCQEAASDGIVYDIDISRLLRAARESRSRLTVAASIGDVVTKRTALLTSQGALEDVRALPIFILSKEGRGDRMGRLLSELKEEGVESLRSESGSGMTAVVDSYAELWLAWPRAWAAYGQRLTGGFMNQRNPFRFTPVDAMRSDLWSLLDIAIERGLREQANSLIGITYRVGREAIDLDAPDILEGVTGLARSALRFPHDSDSRLIKVTNDRAIRLQVELCRYIAIPRLEDARRETSDRLRAAESVSVLFKAIAECLKIVLDNRDDRLFYEFDKEFCRLLEFWTIEPDEYIARQALDDQTVRQQLSVTEEQARDALEMHSIQRDLLTLRATLRLSLLGWTLHTGVTKPLDAKMYGTLLRVARSFDDVEELFQAVGLALEKGNGRLGDWVLSSLPQGDAHFIDDEGPLLRAISLILFTSPTVTAVPPAAWLYEHRIERLKSMLDDMAGDDTLLTVANIDRQRAADMASRLKGALDVSRLTQAAIERAELIRQPLDPAKVHEFREQVAASWSEARTLPDLLALGGVVISPRPAGDWADRRFGFNPSLENKALFVTPSKMIGLDFRAREYGRGLAQAEFAAVISAIQSKSRKLRGRGSVRERVAKGVQQLSLEGFTPSVVVVPKDRWILTALGLPPRWQRRLSSHGFQRLVAGEILGLPVVEASELDNDRVCVIDLAAFLKIHELRDDSTASSSVNCKVDVIGEDLAADIIGSWNRGAGRSERQMSLEELQACVRVVVNRHFELEVQDRLASRLVWIPPSLRVEQESSTSGKGRRK
ncbi:DUF2254 domain-containing protein [Micromonospora aurantiaca]|uniref:DUF2254 domain-containing protein n=1 Tax=Micromonospora aurantiaca (nom. illeg.) TaxID=47850 RepID=A0ABQ6UJS9_9ACTN|nr:DUF2254 domain-containing protein [Micromonospora aurantiaca]KAB1117246.1 DUF2254 domain-containing protein [Micromonospora aurantiaca]UFN93296.1 hypothetical protein LF814_25440 [Micromonospora aurantiaca]